MSYPLVSIIVLNFNGKNFLGKCLDSLFRTNYPNFEVILVDNASTDESVEFVKSNFNYNNLKIICNKRNLGFAEGNNVGAKVARGKYIVFLNNDTEVDPNWLTELVMVMESDESVGAAQSKLLLFDRKTIDSAGDFINFYGFGWMRGHGEVDRGQFSRIKEIFSARGAAMIVRKDLLKEVGFFDPSFFMICEDIDLCWRIRLRGYKVLFVPRSVVYHFSSGSRRGFYNVIQSYYYNTRNALMMLIKNYNIKNLIFATFIYFIANLSLFFMSIPFASRRRYNIERIKAIFWVILHLRPILRERMRVQYSIRKVSDEKIKNIIIKDRSPFLDLSWNLFYKRIMSYDIFINCQVYKKNRWVL